MVLSPRKWLSSLKGYPWAHTLLRAALRVMTIALILLLLVIFSYRFVNPPASTLMATNYLAGKTIRHRWVPLSKISKHLTNAVIMSEDARFCEHWGVDWRAVEQAWADADEGDIPRGASTITMQTIKNLFLWPAQSYVRKAIEIPLAHIATLVWPKKRVLELYLNVAEWGPGVFGVEAAARYHFKKKASELTPRQAALLAASLPNPFVRRAGRPGPKTSRLATKIQNRLKGAGPWTKCIR